MRIAVLRATRALTSGCEKNAATSVFKRRVHPLRKRNSRPVSAVRGKNVAPTEMAKSELAVRFRDIGARVLLKFKWIGCCCTGRSIWRCKVVSNMSLEVNAALAEGAKQATFEKEAQTPSGNGTPASPPRPPGQPAETPAEQNGSGKTPQRSSPTSWPNLTGTSRISRDRTPSTKSCWRGDSAGMPK